MNQYPLPANYFRIRAGLLRQLRQMRVLRCGKYEIKVEQAALWFLRQRWLGKPKDQIQLQHRQILLKIVPFARERPTWIRSL